MPNLEEIDAMLDQDISPRPALETTLGELGEVQPASETDLPHVRDLVSSRQVREATLRAWGQLRADDPAHVPTVRAIAALVGGSRDRLTAEVRLLKQELVMPPQETDAVTAAQAQLATARAAVDAWGQENSAAQADVERCDAVIADLIRRATTGDAEAAGKIEAAKQDLWLAHRKVTVHLSAVKTQLEAEEEEAYRGLAKAERERDHADYNTLAAQRRDLCPKIAEALEALHEFCIAFLSHTQAHRTIATRLMVPFGEPGGAPPERLLAAFIQARLEDVAAPRPGRLYTMPNVPDLATRDATCQDLTAEQLEERAGTGTAWLAYQGHQVPNLASSGIKRPLQDQAAFQHGKPVRLTLDEAEALRAKYGGNDLVVVPPPVWE